MTVWIIIWFNLWVPHGTAQKSKSKVTTIIFYTPIRNTESISGGKILFEYKISDITLTNNPENKNSFSQLFALSYAEKNNPISLDLELRKEMRLNIFGMVLSKFCGISSFFCRDLLNINSKSLPVPISKVSRLYFYY